MSEENRVFVRSDDVVLWLVIVFCFTVPVILVILWTITDRLYPPMLVSILLGIGTAALTYRYLGGTGMSELQLGALKVAGSAAMLLGTAGFTNWGLTTQMTRDFGPRAISILEEEKRTHLRELEQRNQEINRLKAELERETAGTHEALVQRVKTLSPDSFAGRGILDLARRGEGLFEKVKRTLSVRATVTEGPTGLSFDACADLGLATETVRIYPANDGSSTATERHVEARQSGRLSTDQCSNPNASFRIRLSCDIGKSLFPDSIVACSKDGNVGWREARAPRVFAVSIEVLSN